MQLTNCRAMPPSTGATTACLLLRDAPAVASCCGAAACEQVLLLLLLLLGAELAVLVDGDKACSMAWLGPRSVWEVLWREAVNGRGALQRAGVSICCDCRCRMPQAGSQLHSCPGHQANGQQQLCGSAGNLASAWRSKRSAIGLSLSPGKTQSYAFASSLSHFTPA